MKEKAIFATLAPLCDNSDDLAKSRWGVLSFNYICGIITSLMTGTYFTGIMLEMDASDEYISAVTVAITICGFAQFFSPLILERIKKRKPFLLVMRSLYHLFNIVLLGVIPLIPAERNHVLALFIGAVIIANLINALTISGLSIWHIQSIPEHHRSDFFTLANIGVSVLNSLTVFLAARMVDGLGDSGATLGGIGSPMLGFLIIRAIGALIGIAELIILAGIKELPYQENESRKIDIRTLFVPLKNRAFMKVILIYIFYYFVSAIIGRYFQTYLLSVVHMSYTYQSLSSVIGVPIVLLSSPIWSYLLRKTSWKRILPIAIIGMAAGYFFNTLITEGTQYFHIFCCVIYSIFHVAVSIIFSFLPYENMPKTDRTAYISFFTISGSIAGLLGNLFGIAFMSAVQDISFTLFGLAITEYQLLNLVQTLLFIPVSVYSIFATREHKSKTLCEEE